MPTLTIVVASTRDGRAGLPVAEWFVARAQAHGKFAAELVDLKQVKLPLFDEPHHPRLQKYQHEHTKRWSALIQRSDAFVFVTPEYNFGPAPALLNALDYVYREWNYKAAAFVSYGGASGGMRAVQATKLVVAALKMVPLVEAVAIPFFAKRIENGVFTSDDALDTSASVMLDELFRWNEALKVLRD